MKKSTIQSIMTVSILALASFNAASAPAPLAAGTCAGAVVQKVAVAPYAALHGLLTTAVINNLNTKLAAVVDQASYANLLASVTTLKASIVGSGRVVVTLPDGTVVIDTSKTNNTYADFLNKAINENQNTRVAVMDTQIYQCGLGLETRFSTTDQKKENFVARRLGNATSAATYAASYLNNNGSVRVSVK